MRSACELRTPRRFQLTVLPQQDTLGLAPRELRIDDSAVYVNGKEFHANGPCASFLEIAPARERAHHL